MFVLNRASMRYVAFGTGLMLGACTSPAEDTTGDSSASSQSTTETKRDSSAEALIVDAACCVDGVCRWGRCDAGWGPHRDQPQRQHPTPWPWREDTKKTGECDPLWGCPPHAWW